MQAGVGLNAGCIEREDSDARAYEGAAKRPYHYQSKRVTQPRQGRIEVRHALKQHHPGDGGEYCPDGLTECRQRWRRAQRHDKCARRNGWPYLDAVSEEGGDRNSVRGPDRAEITAPDIGCGL